MQTGNIIPCVQLNLAYVDIPLAYNSINQSYAEADVICSSNLLDFSS